jgi:hypothetical protein
MGDDVVRVSVEGIKNGLYVNTVTQTKTFDMNTEATMFPDEFYSFVKELQEQLAEGRIDRYSYKDGPNPLFLY